MSTPNELYRRLIKGMGVEGLEIPATFVKFYTHDDEIPKEIMDYHTEELTLTSCQANKQASLGDAVLLTIDNIGCIAAAITFGIVDQNQKDPLSGSRVYTDIMQDQSDHAGSKVPSPAEFTDGTVYACKDSDMPDYCLFGHDDVGRFKNKETAAKAIKDMIAIQPPTTKGVFFFSKDFTECEVTPDVVTLSVRPVELARLVQAYQYNTGERVESSMGPVRVVNSDLIVRPYLTGKINISTYCVGARLIAKYEADRLGIGMPYSLFEEMVKGMEDSKTGYPFPLYPGAADI